MAAKLKIPNPSEQLVLLNRMAKLIDSGDGLILARKKICGSPQNKIAQILMQHPLYKCIFATYMKERHHHRKSWYPKRVKNDQKN